MGFSRQEYWSGLPCPSPGDLSDPRIKPVYLMSPALAGGFFTTSTTIPELHVVVQSLSRVQLFATLWTVACQAPLSTGFSRQEHWSGLPFPLQCMKVKREREVTQSCPTLSDPMDCSPPGSSAHRFSRQEYWSGVPLPHLS